MVFDVLQYVNVLQYVRVKLFCDSVEFNIKQL